MLSRRLALFALALAALPARADDPKKGEFKPLFNGTDLTGWKTFLDPKAKDVTAKDVWSVVDGTIVCKGKPNGYLLTEKEYGDYVLRVQWKWGAKPGNSGVFVHVSGTDKIWPKGIEAQLQHEHAGDFWLVDNFKLKIDPARQDAKTSRHFFRTKDKIEKPVGEWNQYEITCKGNTVTLNVNGETVNTGTDAEATSGKILLQSEGAEIHFKAIEIKSIK